MLKSSVLNENKQTNNNNKQQQQKIKHTKKKKPERSHLAVTGQCYFLLFTASSFLEVLEHNIA